MPYLLIIPAVMSFLVLAAHYLRDLLGVGGPTVMNIFLVGMSLAAPFLFFVRKRGMLWLIQLLLVMAAVVWVGTAWDLFRERVSEHRPFRAAMIILGSVAVWNVISAMVLFIPAIRRRYSA